MQPTASTPLMDDDDDAEEHLVACLGISASFKQIFAVTPTEPLANQQRSVEIMRSEGVAENTGKEEKIQNEKFVKLFTHVND